MNNTAILKKCLEELSKPEPKIDYIRGMLETLVEVQEPEAAAMTLGVPLPMPKVVPAAPVSADLDEGELLDNKARAMLPGVKAMAAQSTELG